MQDVCELIELTECELDAVAGGRRRRQHPHHIDVDVDIDVTSHPRTHIDNSVDNSVNVGSVHG